MSRRQMRWTIVCGSPQSQLTNCVLSMKPNLLIVVFARPIPVRRRFSKRQQSHGWSDPAGFSVSNTNVMVARASVPHLQSGVVWR